MGPGNIQSKAPQCWRVGTSQTGEACWDVCPCGRGVRWSPVNCLGRSYTVTQDPGPPVPWERGEDILFLFPLPLLEQHGVAKAAWGRHFTQLGPSSAIHRWVVDLPLRVRVSVFTLSRWRFCAVPAAQGACEDYNSCECLLSTCLALGEVCTLGPVRLPSGQRVVVGAQTVNCSSRPILVQHCTEETWRPVVRLWRCGCWAGGQPELFWAAGD